MIGASGRALRAPSVIRGHVPALFNRLDSAVSPVASKVGTAITLGDAPAAVAGALNDPNTALSFDGVNDFGQVALDLSAGNVVSAEFWLWWDTYANDSKVALEYTTNDANGGFLVIPNATSGSFEVRFGTGGADKLINRYSRASIPAAQWNHLTVVIDKSLAGAARTALRANGAALSPTSSPTNTADTSNFANSTLYLMSRAGTSLFGAGRMDELAVYTRALTGNEMLQHYLASKRTRKR